MKLHYLLVLCLCIGLMACQNTTSNPPQGSDSLSSIQKFAPNIISTDSTSENIISFSPDGKTAIFSRTLDWINQTPYISYLENEEWTTPERMTFAEDIYNLTFSQDGQAILFSVRNEEADTTTIWKMDKIDNGWAAPENLTMRYDISGSYPCLLADNTLYYYWNVNNGDIFKTKIKDGKREDIVRLPEPINTEEGNEFSPYMSPDHSFLIFTRYTDGDENQQGIFLTRNSGSVEEPIWSEPKKLLLPYGWGVTISADKKHLYYTDGEDIYTTDAGIVFSEKSK